MSIEQTIDVGTLKDVIRRMAGAANEMKDERGRVQIVPHPDDVERRRVRAISEGQRESIRQEIALGWLTRAAAAKQYGVSRTMINAIVNKVGRVNGGVARPRRKAVAD